MVSTAFQFAGNWLNNEAAGDRQHAANMFSAEQYAHRYQTQVADLQAAGLNPMLAYAQSPGVSPTASAAPTTNLASGVSQAYQQSKLTSAQVANIEADTANKNASAALIQSQTAVNDATAEATKRNWNVIDANYAKITSETQNI